MGLFDGFKRKPSMEVVSLTDVLGKYNIEAVEDTHMVVSPITLSTPDSQQFAYGEIGYSGNSSYGAILREEYNPQMRGVLGLQKFDEMRRSDSQVRSSMRLIKTPVLAARWYMQPASQSKRDVKIAKRIEDNLFKWMSNSWQQHMIEGLGFLDFGFYPFEKVYDVWPDDGLLYWRKFAPRHPFDLERWEYDDHGGPQAGWFYGDSMSAQSNRIPISKLINYVNDQEANSMVGISVLRSAYKHWYYKENLYKVDAIQKERHGIGIPIIKLPPNFTPADKNLADQLGRNLRTNEKSHVVLPPMWEILMLKMEGHPVDCLPSINHHDTQIARNVLAFFMADVPGAGVGDPQQLFFKGTRFVAEVIRDSINKWAIAEIVRLNYGDNVEPPELKVRRIGDTVDWRQISFAIRNFVGAGILVPDDKLEAWIRDEMDLPDADVATARDAGTPQQPGTAMAPVPGSPEAKAIAAQAKAGQPKQSTAANMKIGPGSKRIGGDGAGASGT